jgi:anti-anti-sigma factor
MKTSPDINEISVTLNVAGDLTSTTSDLLRAEIQRSVEAPTAAGRKWSTLVLDLARAKMVDSVGLNLVVSLLKRTQAQGAKMQIIYSSPNVLRTFTFTRLDRHVEMVKV